MDTQTGIIYTDQQIEIMKKLIGKNDGKILERLIEMKIPPTSVQMDRRPPRVGRNESCPCGSGKKYKKCHLWEDQGYKISGGKTNEG